MHAEYFGMDVVGKGTKALEEHPVMEKGAVRSISRTPFSFLLVSVAPGLMEAADLHLLGLIHLHAF